MFTNCIEFPGARRNGYGILNRRVDGRKTTVNAHRWVYEGIVGKIPEGMTLDHICRNRACVNVVHLEVVTRSVNKIRAMWYAPRPTHCGFGHEFTPENTWIRPDRKHRACRQCAGLQPAIGGSDAVIGGQAKRTPEEMELNRWLVSHEGDVLYLTEATARQYEVLSREFLDRNFTPRSGHKTAAG